VEKEDSQGSSALKIDYEMRPDGGCFGARAGSFAKQGGAKRTGGQ
jgi:hypothetical protein